MAKMKDIIFFKGSVKKCYGDDNSVTLFETSNKNNKYNIKQWIKEIYEFLIKHRIRFPKAVFDSFVLTNSERTHSSMLLRYRVSFCPPPLWTLSIISRVSILFLKMNQQPKSSTDSNHDHIIDDDSSPTILDITSFQLHDLDSIELPQSLVELDLTANRLSTLDPRIRHLTNLKKLSLRQNLFKEDGIEPISHWEDISDLEVRVFIRQFNCHSIPFFYE